MNHIRKFQIKIKKIGKVNPNRALAPRQLVRQRPYHKTLNNHFIGRREEKRLAVVMDVEIASVKSASAERREIAHVDNLSAHGARVYAKSPWQLGDNVEITMAVEAPVRAEVIYCQEVVSRFAVGLKFHRKPVLWSIFQQLEGMLR